MAGKRESLERNAIQERSRAASAQQHFGDSMQRGFRRNGNISAPNKDEACIMEPENIQEKDVGISNTKTQFSATSTQNSTSTAADENFQHTSPNQRINGQTLLQQTQGPGTGDQNQNYPTIPASQSFIGIIPPRELDTGPQNNEADNTPNYRRMAVCQETDDAVDQRTKMRVYMKRF